MLLICPANKQTKSDDISRSNTGRFTFPISPFSHHLPLPPLPLPCTLSRIPVIPPPPLLPLLFRIQHKAQHIERKLRILQAHLAEAALGLMPQHMRPLTPKTSHRLPNRRVLPLRVRVHVARIRQLRNGRRRHEVDFAVGEGLQCGEGEAFGEGVDFGVLEQLGACVVYGGG